MIISRNLGMSSSSIWHFLKYTLIFLSNSCCNTRAWQANTHWIGNMYWTLINRVLLLIPMSQLCCVVFQKINAIGSFQLDKHPPSLGWFRLVARSHRLSLVDNLWYSQFPESLGVFDWCCSYKIFYTVLERKVPINIRYNNIYVRVF